MSCRTVNQQLSPAQIKSYVGKRQKRSHNVVLPILDLSHADTKVHPNSSATKKGKVLSQCSTRLKTKARRGRREGWLGGRRRHKE